MADYIYSRVSTDNQSVDPQLHQLTKLYPEAITVSEVASGAKKRPKLEELINKLSSDDRLIVVSIDRLGRKVLDLLQTMETLNKKGIKVISVREGIDYSTAVGRLIFQVLSAVSEMERNLIVERTKAGLAVARAKGKRLGRPVMISAERKAAAIRLVVSKKLSVSEAARRSKMSAWYLSRLVKQHRGLL